MSLLDELTIKDMTVDSTEVLAAEAGAVVTDEYCYDYWLYALFDYMRIPYESSVQCLENCFSSCAYVRNYRLEMFENFSGYEHPEWIKSKSVSWTSPCVRVLFNMNGSDLRSVVKFLATLFQFVKSNTGEVDRYTPLIRTIIITNQHSQSYYEFIRADFTRYDRVSNFTITSDGVMRMLVPFGITEDDYQDNIDRVTIRDEHRRLLRSLRDRETGGLKATVNYEFEDPPGSEVTDVVPYIVCGRDYTELVVRMIYLECVGMEQMCMNVDFDFSDAYEGWKDAWRFPMPEIGEDAYDRFGELSDEKKEDLKYLFRSYDRTERMLWRMSRYFNGNPLEDTQVLRMVLPNVIGRIARTCEDYQYDAWLLAEELFDKVNELDVGAVIAETVRETDRINGKTR